MHPWLILGLLCASFAVSNAQEGGNGDGQPYALDFHEFKTGRQWTRLTKMQFADTAGPAHRTLVLVTYSVVQGYDGKAEPERIVIEVSYSRTPNDNNPFRIVMNKNGMFEKFLLKRGQDWIDWDKANGQTKTSVFILHDALLDYAFLTLPLKWENSVEEFTTNRWQKVIVAKVVRADALMVTCIIKKQKEFLPADELPQSGDPIEDVINLTFAKGEPWATSATDVMYDNFNLSMPPAKAKEP
jgi:hypothetical protein